MSRGKAAIILVVAIVAGLLTGGFVFLQLRNARRPLSTVTGHIVVVTTRVALGTRLAPQQLRLLAWAADGPVPGMFTRIEDCVGRVTAAPLVPNEPVLEENLAPKDAKAGLPAAIPEGMRAISVAVNDVIAVAGFALPGTIVDVLVTGNPEGGSGGNSVTRTILQQIRVLAAGQKVEQDKDGKPQTVAVITLLVTPEDAARLSMASTEGKIQLALRNTTDTKQANPPPVFGASIFGTPATGSASQPRTERAPEPIKNRNFVVEVLRGNKREDASFPAP
jgi:pilus assembly protein CpaB